MSAKKLTKTVWVQIRPEWGTSPYSRDSVIGIKVDKIYQNKPPKSAGLVVEMKLSVPEMVFKPLRPKITVDIPLAQVDLAPLVKMEIEGLAQIVADTA